MFSHCRDLGSVRLSCCNVAVRIVTQLNIALTTSTVYNNSNNKKLNKSRRLKQNRTPPRFCFARRRIEVSKGFPPCRFYSRSHTHRHTFTHTGALRPGVPHQNTREHCMSLSRQVGGTTGEAGSAHNQRGRENQTGS
jgi:hypothetical protein